MGNGKVSDSRPPLPYGAPASSGLSDFLQAAARKGYNVTIVCQGDSVLIAARDPALREDQPRRDRGCGEAIDKTQPVAELVGRLAATGMPVALHLSEA